MLTSGKIGHNYSPLLYTLCWSSCPNMKQLSIEHSNSVIVIKECPSKVLQTHKIPAFIFTEKHWKKKHSPSQLYNHDESYLSLESDYIQLWMRRYV
jgi:hypothetical protein